MTKIMTNPSINHCKPVLLYVWCQDMVPAVYQAFGAIMGLAVSPVRRQEELVVEPLAIHLWILIMLKDLRAFYKEVS